MTASLKKLQSEDERKLLDVVDKMRRAGLNGTIELPQLVVCGDQSSGKSSVLEAVSIFSSILTDVPLIGLVPDYRDPIPKEGRSVHTYRHRDRDAPPDYELRYSQDQSQQGSNSPRTEEVGRIQSNDY